MPSQHYVHLFTGPDNLSHFKDVEVELGDRGGGGSFLSETMPATGINFRQNSMSYDLDWHPAPRRQFIINLTGAVKITASDGEVRIFGPGSIMLADDTTGKGHLSQHEGDVERVSLFIHVPEDLAL